jgi:hypothetical protein
MRSGRVVRDRRTRGPETIVRVLLLALMGTVFVAPDLNLGEPVFFVLLVQSGARRHGEDGIHGKCGIVEPVTYTI